MLKVLLELVELLHRSGQCPSKLGEDLTPSRVEGERWFRVGEEGVSKENLDFTASLSEIMVLEFE